VSDELLKNILYYIAKSELENGAIAAVKKQFNLAAALPNEQELKDQRAALSGPDKETVGSVVGALIEEISALKDKFDLLVCGDDDRTETLTSLLPMFKQISDTMGMLGLGMPRRVLQEQQGSVARLIDQGSVSDSELMDTAGALLYVEATLNGMQAEGTLLETKPEDVSVNSAQKAVLHEARNVLEQVKDSIVEYIAKQWDVAELEEAPHWLRSIEGSINMIPLPRVAKILEGAANFVEQQLIAEDVKAQWAVMDSFADILTSIEYYIERYSHSPLEANDQLLHRAEVALSNLLGHQDDAQLEESPAISRDSDMGTLEQIDYTEDTVMSAEVGLAATPDGVAELEIEAIEVDEPVLTAEVGGIPEVVVERVEAVEPVEDDLIDDEIIEIFLEEAEEVLAILEDNWPAYKDDHSDKEVQSTIRRAFHTLKGSGRMVKAEVIGELAWSIENMLNRVIDHTIVLENNAIALIDQVIRHIPELIEDFRTRVTGRLDIAPIIHYAESLSQGENVAEFHAHFSTVENDVAEVEIVETEGNLLDDTLIDIFRTEVSTHLEAVNDFITEAQQTNFNNKLSDQLQRALHTLKGSAHMAGITPIALIASPLEKLVKELRAYQIRNTPGLTNLLVEGSALIQLGIEQLETSPVASLPNEGQFLIRVTEIEQL
ncbi:MAG: Hpt domain-containing protein, partial [Oleispira sp.]|nr:Hpt domain-containing protein [Oleispira sp.]